MTLIHIFKLKMLHNYISLTMDFEKVMCKIFLVFFNYSVQSGLALVSVTLVITDLCFVLYDHK